MTKNFLRLLLMINVITSNIIVSQPIQDKCDRCQDTASCVCVVAGLAIMNYLNPIKSVKAQDTTPPTKKIN